MLSLRFCVLIPAERAEQVQDRFSPDDIFSEHTLLVGLHHGAILANPLLHLLAGAAWCRLAVGHARDLAFQPIDLSLSAIARPRHLDEYGLLAGDTGRHLRDEGVQIVADEQELRVLHHERLRCLALSLTHEGHIRVQESIDRHKQSPPDLDQFILTQSEAGPLGVDVIVQVAS